MSIDREINQRVEAYGNNPGALRKRYATSKQLIDLLALQRLKSQKDAAARKIQMEMEQMPGTIKAQREQELMGQNVQDLTKRTADTMRNMAQKKQMKAMQKGVAERAKGLASLTGNPQMAMAQQNRPQQPQRMQAGGIVALAGGLRPEDAKRKQQIQSLINQGKSDEEIRQEMAELGLLPQAADRFIKMVREQRREDMASAPKKEEPRRGGRLAQSDRMEAEAREAAPRPELNIFDKAKPDDVEELKRRGLLPPNFKGSISSRRAEEMLARPAQAPEKPEGIAAVAEQPKKPVEVSPEAKPKPEEVVVAEEAGMEEKIPESAIQNVKNGKVNEAFNLREELDALPELKAETVNRKGADERGMDVLKMFGRAPEDLQSPQEAGRLAKEESYRDYGIEAKDKERRAGLAQLEALDKAQRDPDKLRRERLMARLIAGSQGGLGAAAAGGARAAQSQGRALRDRQKERMGIVKDIQQSNTDLVKLAKGDQKSAIERQTNMITNAMNTLSNYETAEMQTRATEASNRNATQIANYEGKVARIEMLADDAQNKIENRIATGEVYQDSIDQAMESMGEVSERLDELTQQAVQLDPIVKKIKEQLDKEQGREAGLNPFSRDPDPEKVSELRKKLIARIEQLEAGMLLANPKLYERFNSLKNAILKAEGSRDRALLPPEDEAYIRQFSG